MLGELTISKMIIKDKERRITTPKDDLFIVRFGFKNEKHNLIIREDFFATKELMMDHYNRYKHFNNKV